MNDNVRFNGETAQAQIAVLFPDFNHISQALEIAKYNATIKQQERLKLFGSAILYSNDILNQGGKSLEGLVLAIPSPASKKFAQAAAKQWGGEISWRTASSFDATQAFIQAIKNVSNNPTRETVLSAMKEVNVPSDNTSGEALKFTSEGERETEPVLVQVKGGKFIIIP